MHWITIFLVFFFNEQVSGKYMYFFLFFLQAIPLTKTILKQNVDLDLLSRPCMEIFVLCGLILNLYELVVLSLMNKNTPLLIYVYILYLLYFTDHD